MAFPQVEATNNSADSGTSHTVNLPADILADETLLVFFATDRNAAVTFPEGWTKLFEYNYSFATTLAIAWRKADGEEGASITVTTDASEQSAHISYRISGATDPTSTPPEVTAEAHAVSDSPDPGSLTPAGGSKQYLWIAIEGNDNDDLVTVYPTNYGNGETYYSATGVGACAIGVARRELETASEDPGTFTIAASQGWVACTVAVHPTEVVGLSIPIAMHHYQMLRGATGD